MDKIIIIASTISGLSSLIMTIYSIILRQKVKAAKKREKVIRPIVTKLNKLEAKNIQIVKLSNEKIMDENIRYKELIEKIANSNNSGKKVNIRIRKGKTFLDIRNCEIDESYNDLLMQAIKQHNLSLSQKKYMLRKP